MKQSQGIARYREFLVARDGEADLLRRRLPKREKFFDNLMRRPVRSRASVDRAIYLRNLRRRRHERGLDARMLWILATAKANQAERFGVGLAELLGRVSPDDPANVHVMLQETYHTRILADVVAMFGLPVNARPPRILIRVMIHLMVCVPERFILPLIGASEMVGCVLFRELRDKGLELFRDEVAVCERIRLLYDQILADEIGHVAFAMARLSKRGRAVMLWLYSRFSTALTSQFGELATLLGEEELAKGLAEFHLSNEAAQIPEAFALTEADSHPVSSLRSA